jgi:predicted ATP-dependent protease
MKALVEELQAVIPAAFEGEEYQTQKQAILDEVNSRQEEGMEAINRRAVERGITLLRTQGGLAFAPRRDGKIIAPEEFVQLPAEEQERLQGEIGELQDELQRLLRQVPLWTREGHDRVKRLDEEVATFAVGPQVKELRQKYAALPDVVLYLDEVEKSLIANVDQFLPAPPDAGEGSRPRRSGFMNRYQVNVLVDHAGQYGAPVVYEDHPTYQNLLGRVEHIAQMGALLTDFTLVKPGALHKANGGYLLLDARKVMLQPYTWESLKRALQAGEIRIEAAGQNQGLLSTVTVEPEPIPLKVKVILLGDRLLYYLLYENDPDFSELFKVAVDFDIDFAVDDTY